MALRVDPSMTGMLARGFAKAIRSRLAAVADAVREKLIDEDALGLERPKSPFTANAERQVWIFHRDKDKLKAFSDWLGDVFAAHLGNDPWVQDYVDNAHTKGVGRAYGQVSQRKIKKSQDWFVGAMAEFIRGVKANPEIVARLGVIAARAFEDIKGLSKQAATKLNRILANGLLKKWSPARIAREMTKEIKDLSEKRALLIARTEMVYAQAEGQLDAFETLGIKKVGLYVEWVTAGDEHVCELCEPMEGIQFTIDEARGLIPRHPNCVTGDMAIESPDPLAVMKGTFTGRVVEVVTTQGRRLTVTENHVLLTKGGWVQAKDLREGDHLVDASAFYGGGTPTTFGRKAVGSPNHDEAVPPIQQVFGSLVELARKFGGLDTVASGAEDFHGDGRSLNKEVEIVSLHRLLGYDVQRQLACEFQELPFELRKWFLRPGADLITQRALAKFLHRTAHTADRSMGRLRVSPVLLRGAPRHDQPVSFGGGPQGDVVLRKDSIDKASTETKSLGDRQTIDSGRVEPDDFLGDIRVHFDVARVVLFHHVVGLPVYDVSTASSMYSINGILSSNCRCAWEPAIAYAGHNRTRDMQRAVGSSVAAERSGAGSKAERVRRARKSSVWGGKRLIRRSG